MKSVKEEIREWLDTLPDGVSFEEVQHHLYVRQTIERGLQDVEEGRAVSQAEAERRLSKWLGG